MAFALLCVLLRPLLLLLRNHTVDLVFKRLLPVGSRSEFDVGMDPRGTHGMHFFMACLDGGKYLVPFAFNVGSIGMEGGLQPGTVEHLFAGDDEPTCLDGADANDDGSVNLSDAVATLNYLFAGGDAPAFPGPSNCGWDSTDEGSLGCEQLYMTGISTNMCVESTAREAADRGYAVTLIEDACATTHADLHDTTMRNFRRLFGRVLSTDEALAELG